MRRDDIVQLAEMMRSKYRHGAQDVHMTCPNREAHKHGDTHISFSIKVSPGEESICYCFACKIKGSIKVVFKTLCEAGQVAPEVFEYIRVADEPDLRTLLAMRLQRKEEDKGVKETPPQTIADFVRIWSRRRDVDQYYKYRGLYVDEITSWGLGYDPEKKRGIFPIKTHRKEVVGAIGRALYDWQSPKYWKYDSLRDDVLFGEDKVDLSQEVVLVEGPMDAIVAARSIPNVLALCGTTITPRQRERLLHFADSVVLMLDGDEAGQLGAERVGKLLYHRCRVYVVELPQGKDPGGMDSLELHHLCYTNRVVF